MAANVESDSKHRKLNDFRKGLPHCSQAALSAILGRVRQYGLPDQSSEKNFREASNKLLGAMDWHGPLWQTSEAFTNTGKTISVIHINIQSLLAGLFNAGGCFQAFLEKVHSHTPSSAGQPWRAVFYSDEVHPGHQLSSSSRKVWTIYMAFLEYGRHLSREDVWMPVFICRSSVVNQLASSIGQIFKLVLECMFSNPVANPLLGVRMKNPQGEHMVLYWTVSMFLQDGAAHKMTFGNRQDGGSRICMMCKNIFLSKALYAAGDDEGGPPEEEQPTLANYLKLKDLDLSTGEDILQSWQRMKGRKNTVNKGEWKVWCQVAGVDYTDHALLLSECLNELGLLHPTTSYVHDYMHALCSKGAMCFIAFWLIDELCLQGMTNIWTTLCEYLQLWVPPDSFKAIKPFMLFLPKAVEGHKASKYIKCSASEMLSLYRPLAYFLHTCCLANNFLEKECLCFLSWCTLLDFMVSIPFMQEADPQVLQDLVEDSLQHLKACGWAEKMRPKMHWPLHWPRALKHFKCLPACWSLERKHKSIRRYGSNCCNMKVYDHFVMKELLCEQVASLTSTDQSWFQDGCALVKPKKPDKKLKQLLYENNLVVGESGQCFCAHSCKLANGMTASVGDVVLLSDPASRSFPFKCGCIKAFLDLGKVIAIVEEYALVEHLPKLDAIKCDSTNTNMLLVDCQAVESPMIFSKSSEGGITCLVPSHVKMMLQSHKA